MIKHFLIKIITNLRNPFKIPQKILRKINYFFKLRSYDFNFYKNKQQDIFYSSGLNREDGIKNLNEIKNKLSVDINIKREMSSEHEVMLSSISLIKNSKIENILEVGTYDGFNALLLSKLFPNSKISTIDLPEDDKDFIASYKRKNQLIEFIENRKKNLSLGDNIEFIPMNSIKLINHKKKYDLIWIDGAHGYPIVSIDIINAMNLINVNGIIACDDILIDLNHQESDKIYNSIAAYETLSELKKQKLIDFQLIYKRLNAENNCVSYRRKFISIIKKINKE